MADISIPGISDKYKTNDLVNSLVEVEKIPLKREQEKLESIKTEQTNWRRVNQYMSSLRESARALYSFDNPFNERTATSTDENAITATPTRDANLESFKIDVVQTAKADRFLSKNLEKNQNIPEGTYKFTVGDKTITYRWKGGKIQDFVDGINKRGNGVIKASLIGVSKDETSFLIESLKTGEENKLVFEQDSLKLAYDLGIIQDAKGKNSQKVINEKIESLNTGNTEIKIPKEIAKNPNGIIEFSINNETLENADGETVSNSASETSANADGETAANSAGETSANKDGETVSNSASETSTINMPFAGKITFKDVTVYNDKAEIGFELAHNETAITSTTAETQSGEISANKESETVAKSAGGTSENQNTKNAIYVKNKDGSLIEIENFEENFSQKNISLKISDYENIDSIVFEKNNANSKIQISKIDFVDEKNSDLPYEPVNAISVASNAKIKYEGILMERPTNKIDDAIENLTLELHDTTEKTATIKVENNVEDSKDALITFIGSYNQLLAELNILTQNKPEIIDELEYLSDEEKEKAYERLGAFQTDTTLKNNKSSLQTIMISPYEATSDAQIRTLAQIGISTKASSGQNLSTSQMHGYMEIDEKKLDEVLKNDMDDVKNLFGFDSDGDKIIDSGIAFQMDKVLQAYVQTGGIIALKTSALDRQISNQETKIQRLEEQVANKESDLKRKYGNMEATLNNLQSQSSSISNFANQNNK